MDAYLPQKRDHPTYSDIEDIELLLLTVFRPIGCDKLWLVLWNDMAAESLNDLIGILCAILLTTIFIQTIDLAEISLLLLFFNS